jgi:hypothetical protein
MAKVMALSQVSAVLIQVHFGWGKKPTLIPSSSEIPMKKVSGHGLKMAVALSGTKGMSIHRQATRQISCI